MLAKPYAKFVAMVDESGIPLTPVGKIGEFGLIEKITAGFSAYSPDLLKGIGDDAAVIRINDEESLLISTDLLMEAIHFDIRYVPLKHLGYKAIAVNLSDIFAMNGVPTGVTVSIAFGNRYTVEAIEEIYEGVRAACEEFKIDLLGGDTSSSATGLAISVTAVGRALTDSVVYRSGAKATNLICVSGDLGAAYAGLQLLEREKEVYLADPEMQPDLSGRDYVVGRQLRPVPRKDIIEKLKEIDIQPTSMIDVSDGLSSDLKHLCKASGTGARIYQQQIPIDHETISVADDFKIHELTYALNGGEDYELLFTIDMNQREQISLLKDVRIIGYMTAEDDGLTIVNLETNQIYDLGSKGFDHFNRETEDADV